MPLTCSVCAHPKRKQIDRALLSAMAGDLLDALSVDQAAGLHAEVLAVELALPVYDPGVRLPPVNDRLKGMATSYRRLMSVVNIAIDMPPRFSASLLAHVASAMKEVDQVYRVHPSAFRPPITEAMRRHVKQRDCSTCRYCGRVGSECRDADGNSWNIDHVIPVIAGGRSNEGNLVLSCRSCNMWKRDRLDVVPVGWRDETESL